MDKNSSATPPSVALSDKFDRKRGPILITGKQALARVPLIQSEFDRRAGIKSAGYVSGYRGSPLGTIDTELHKIQSRLDAADVVFEPGLNEDLAMTAVWGSQQLEFVPDPKFDGVFAIWYGKGPGVDRSGDAIKHANMAGTHPKGGVLLAFGDDHSGKSSSTAHQSDLALAAHDLPILYPSDVSDILSFGLAGIAMSRYSGLVVGLKFVNETADCTQIIDYDQDALIPILPKADGSEADVSIRAEFLAVQAQDQRIVRHRLPRAKAFARVNGIDRVAFGSDEPPLLGIVTAGKPFQDVIDALRLLGIDDAKARRLGVGVLKVGMIYPLDELPLWAFGTHARELFFVEEKRSHMERQAAAAFYNRDRRPAISGKTTPEGAGLPADEPLDAHKVASALGQRILSRLIEAGDAGAAEIKAALGRLDQLAEEKNSLEVSHLKRAPAFCSGCPHNLSTKVPEGSFGVAGIGCHGLVQFMDRAPLPCTHMGAEGVNWVGLSHFTGTKHVFVNLGDGTFSHSGSLAIRAATRSKANVTFKILVNDVVAMTGGQQVESSLSVSAIVHLLQIEGVGKVVVLADDIDALRAREALPSNVELRDRRHLETVQRQLREVAGTTAIIFSQICATEKRKRRKRGTAEKARRHVVINAAVCEGCGDCSRASNCMSVQPLETEFGRKRQIDQSSCNSDLSCLEGFCPSFVTIEGGERRHPEFKLPRIRLEQLPSPPVAEPELPRGIMFAGIGGTGVVTASAILAMAAHLEGRGASLYDMTGLAQKGGAVYSHLRLLPVAGEGVAPFRLGSGDASVLIAGDLVAAGQAEALQTIHPGGTIVVANTQVQATQSFHEQRDIDLDGVHLMKPLERRSGRSPVRVPATALAEAVFGDSIAANMILVGAAFQLGGIPLAEASIEEAIRLNGAAVAMTVDAFRIGRLSIASPGEIDTMLGEREGGNDSPATDLDVVIERRVALLEAYQNIGYARRFSALVQRIRRAEEAVSPGSTALTRSVAVNACKVMAYKDEYEVARLLSDDAFIRSLRDRFTGERLTFHLAPPFLSGTDASTGRPRKRQFGQWMLPVFRGLRRLKILRGTPFDPFGWMRERRAERQFRDAYLATVDEIADRLGAHNFHSAIDLASWPDQVRGFGPVKDQARTAAQQQAILLKDRFKAAIDDNRDLTQPFL